MSNKQSLNAGPIKATWLRTHLTRLAVFALKRLRPRISAVLFLTPSICVKYGRFQHLSSAAMMQLIASNTSVPVPKIYCAFTRKGTTYIVMSRIDGVPIGEGWAERSKESKSSLLEQLKSLLEELRSIEPEMEGAVTGCGGDKIYDVRLNGGVDGIGPFDTVDEFHTYLREGAERSEAQIREVNDLIDYHKNRKYTTRLTHGDLNSRNILIKEDKIVGIVDWDTAGWYPEYWEYTTASEIGPYNAFTHEDVRSFLEEYPDAIHMEQLRRKYFGAY